MRAQEIGLLGSGAFSFADVATQPHAPITSIDSPFRQHRLPSQPHQRARHQTRLLARPQPLGSSLLEW
jgi:hypothetical protein